MSMLTDLEWSEARLMTIFLDRIARITSPAVPFLSGSSYQDR